MNWRECKNVLTWKIIFQLTTFQFVDIHIFIYKCSSFYQWLPPRINVNVYYTDFSKTKYWYCQGYFTAISLKPVFVYIFNFYVIHSCKICRNCAFFIALQIELLSHNDRHTQTFKSHSHTYCFVFSLKLVNKFDSG